MSTGSSERGPILVVDDDANVREIATQMLSRAGYAVVRASCRDSALGTCREIPISLAVLDVVMPVVDGPSLLVELRQIRPELPAVFMSGKSAAAVGDVPGEFVPKPFTRESLLSAVRNALGEGSTAS